MGTRARQSLPHAQFVVNRISPDRQLQGLRRMGVAWACHTFTTFAGCPRAMQHYASGPAVWLRYFRGKGRIIGTFRLY